MGNSLQNRKKLEKYLIIIINECFENAGEPIYIPAGLFSFYSPFLDAYACFGSF